MPISRTKISNFFLMAAVILLVRIGGPSNAEAEQISAGEARAIAKEAYIYGFPIVDSYRIQYAYFVNQKSPEYKASWNQIRSIPRVYTPDDKAVQTPNSDTPYSMIGMDLRSEPLVLTVPAIETDRYFSIQLIDLYTFNFDYIGSRVTGNDGGNYLIAGPNWKGQVPAGVKKVIRSETELVLGVYRTQLMNPGDIENVKKIQSNYKVQALSSFLGQSSPTPAPAIQFVQPLTAEAQKSSLDFFKILNFVLQFAPTHPSEKELFQRFAKISVGAGTSFNPEQLSPEIMKAIEQGISDAWTTFAEFKKSELDSGKTTSGEMFGTREFLKNNYLYRMAGAVVGIFANSRLEAMYPFYSVDSDGQALDGTSNRYTLHFRPGELPPVHAFWSITMYELPASLLSANSLNRYLLNSSMLPQFKREPDGGLTFFIQHESPGDENEANWLPTPKGPFFMAMRLYWPREDALSGKWVAPALKRRQ